MKKLVYIASFFVAFTAQAQLTNFSELWKEYEFRGDELYNDGLYEAAIEAYQKQLEEYPDDSRVMVRIAESYKHLGNYELAGQYFKSLGRSYQLDNKYFEDYAEVLLAEGNVEEALEIYNEVLELNPQSKVIKEKIHGLEEWDKFFKYEEYAVIENTPFNTDASEFGIRKFASGLAFTSTRIRDRIILHNYLREVNKLTAIYTLESEKDNSPELLSISHLRKSNDGPHAVHGYNYVISRSFAASKDKETVLGLYFYQLADDGKLKPVEPFSFNSPEYSVTHPAYNSRGDTLFFASDMPAGFGGFDIYYSIYRNDSWSAPVNLGEPVNTSRNELFPYSDDGDFYFSSTGHEGIGGLDIYKLASVGDSIFVENMGAPVNSGWDDFGIYIEEDEGYFSSNRPGGEGLDDIYKFKLLPRPQIIEPVEVSLSLFDNLSELPVEMAEVKVINESGTIEAVSDEKGRILKALMPGEYTVVVSRELYDEKSFKLVVEEYQPIKNEVGLEPAFQVHLVSPDSIMFRFGEYNLLHADADEELDAIVATLKEHQEFNLEISAHTDSRGSRDYNQWLSERRAETAANYIIDHGIQPSRISQKGYGETQLLNNCRDGVRCSDKLHAVNRRLEFDFIRIEDPGSND